MRLLTRPEKFGHRQLRQELVGVCEGDCCAALILDLFEFWTVASIQQEKDPWLPGGRERVARWLCGSYSPRAVADRLDKLVHALGFLETREPETGCEREYVLSVEATNKAITEFARVANLPGGVCKSAGGGCADLPPYKEREVLREVEREEKIPLTPLPAARPVQESHERSVTATATGEDPGQDRQSDHVDRLAAEFEAKNARREARTARRSGKFHQNRRYPPQSTPKVQRSEPQATVTPPKASCASPRPKTGFRAKLWKLAEDQGVPPAGNGVPDWMLDSLGAYYLGGPAAFLERAGPIFEQAREQGLTWAAALNALYMAEKNRPGKTKRESAAEAERERTLRVLAGGAW